MWATERGSERLSIKKNNGSYRLVILVRGEPHSCDRTN